MNPAVVDARAEADEVIALEARIGNVLGGSYDGSQNPCHALGYSGGVLVVNRLADEERSGGRHVAAPEPTKRSPRER